MPGNNLGRRQPGNSAVPSTVGHLGVNGFWVGDYVRGGGPGRPPCWRTLEESCKGLGSVSLQNKQPTHTGGACYPESDRECLQWARLLLSVPPKPP